MLRGRGLSFSAPLPFARHGIGVYLYLNEPRAMPESFFKRRPELAGVREEQYAALCTSQPAVRAWMTGALAYVFSNVPELAGVFTMTASENLTSCASHGGRDPVQQHLRNRQYPLSPRDGPRGGAHP